MADSPTSPSSDQEPEDAVNNVVFPRKLLKRFIALYKDLPCLWDRHCQWYKVKARRHEAVTKLTELVQQHDPSATRVHVLRKIESLRACVRRERKRVRDSQRTATSPEDVYKPHLWYYDLFAFVFSEDEMYNYSYVVTTKRAKTRESEDEDIEGADGDDYQQGLDKYSGDYSLATSLVEVSDSSKLYDDEGSSKANKRHCTEVDDEYDAIGVNVAAKLRYLPPNMRILAEKLINDVLFQAQVNGLSSATVISTPDPFK